MPLSRSQKPDQNGLVGQIVAVVVALVVFGILVSFMSAKGQASTKLPEITSGFAGYCLDDYRGSTAPNSTVDSWTCNGTTAQDWTFSGQSIKHEANGCLGVENNGQNIGDKIVLNTCSGASGQKWQLDLGGYQNPASGLCLAVPDGQTKVQLIVASCNNLSHFNETWTATTWTDPTATTTSSPSCAAGSKGQQIACYAERQWTAWQSDPGSHTALLTDYTDGNAYEPWCADFVSYVYNEAGYPFANGERNGWDEYQADNIQNMGFTLHPAGSGYVPEPGDVAYFDYPGGHVEIVVSGGQHPVFIFGDSATTDPATGNGEMAENSLTSDGSAGSLQYYLSPN